MSGRDHENPREQRLVEAVIEGRYKTIKDLAAQIGYNPKYLSVKMGKSSFRSLVELERRRKGDKGRGLLELGGDLVRSNLPVVRTMAADKQLQIGGALVKLGLETRKVLGDETVGLSPLAQHRYALRMLRALAALSRTLARHPERAGQTALKYALRAAALEEMLLSGQRETLDEAPNPHSLRTLPSMQPGARPVTIEQEPDREQDST